MNTPLFSVIVPIYRVESFLNECVESLIKQTYQNIEIILVDDGSPDNCPKICDDYAKKDERIKVIHKKNGGIVSARQVGVELAQGEYIACIDGDDWIDLEYFMRFTKIILQYNPDIICCGSVWVYQNKEVKKNLALGEGIYDKQKIINHIFPILIENSKGEYFSASVWGKVFKKRIYQREQLANCSVNIGEDAACVKPCIYYANSMYIMNDCLYYYRQNPKSITKDRKAFDWEGPKLIGQHFENQIPMDEFDFQEQVYRNITHNLFNVAVSQFNRKQKYNIIRKNILEKINEPYYKNAIVNCRYKKNLKGNLAKYSLKFGITFLMFLYNKLKSR